MFKKGDFVVNANNGICEITDTTTMKVSGQEKEYYVLVPLQEQTAKVFISVDTAENKIRLAMNEEEARDVIKSIKSVEVTYVENDKEREKIFREALTSCDPGRLVSIIKTIYLRKQKRLEEGKKGTAVDERYFKLAENHLHSELAFSLGVEKSEVTQIIASQMES